MADGMTQQSPTAEDSRAEAIEPTFRIGLTMAGAISAGAYTAGVLDFLVEALEDWEAVRDPAIPTHHPVLKVVAGASAGSITGAIGLIAMARGIQRQRLDASEIAGSDRQPNINYNPYRCVLPSLYTAWVEQPCLVADKPGKLDFLDVSDLDATTKGEAPMVVSVLNSKLLDEIKGAALRGTGAAATQRPYLASELHLYMTVSNLRGIPYTISFGAGEYGMQTHGDRFHYRLEGVGSWPCSGSGWLDNDCYIPLDTTKLPAKPDDAVRAEWDLYGTVALASAAFPAGLASREVETEFRQFYERAYPVDVDDTFIIKPKFPGIAPDFVGNYTFRNVDGGLVNNSPFDYAEYALLGRPRLRPRPDPDCTQEGKMTEAALIMIAPFPEPPAFLPEGQPKADLSAVIQALIPTLMTQARFRSSDLAQALDPENYSRYLISPQRLDSAGKEARFKIACGALGGFGGFLDRAFRAHDYQLGRRNCQQFLRQAFNLPGGAHALGHSSALYGIVSQDTQMPVTPVIPLVGDAEREVSLPRWPRLSQADLQKLGHRIERRVEKLLPLLIKTQTKNWRLRLIGSVGLFFGKKRLLDAVRLVILADLIRRDQIEGWELPQGFACDADDARAVLAELASPAFEYRTFDGIAKATHLLPKAVEAIVGALKLASGNPCVVAASWDSKLLTLKIRAPRGVQTWRGIALVIRWFSPPSRDDRR